MNGWAIGRHHGLATPFLDWTESPYVAAYFAFTGFAESVNPDFAVDAWILTEQSPTDFRGGTVAIWGLDSEDVFVEGEFERVRTATYNNVRLRAQRGVLTRLRHDHLFDVESYLAQRGRGSALVRWEISSSETPKVLFDLFQMNITPMTLFPDLIGAARAANTRNVARIWAGAPTTGMGTLPYVVYGKGLTPGDQVFAVVNGQIAARATATRAGEWTMLISSDSPGKPTSGTPIEFVVNGEKTGVTDAWASGKTPSDIANGLSLRNGTPRRSDSPR